MPRFARSFATHALAQSNVPGNAIRELFDRWALPGEKSVREKPLRLAVRDGYVNFYVKGQSVAKLSCGRDGPRLSVHDAYVSGRKKRSERDGDASSSQTYQSFDAKALADPETAAHVANWIDTAETYASAEKRFVDELVAANPGTVDIEMGLPASDLAGGVRVAPRMDLVIAQVTGDAPPSIAFWEAKCANNSELRANAEYEQREGGFTGPKVLDQLRKYAHWMSEDGRIIQVQQAYRDAAATLLEFHRLFRTSETVHECVRIWQTLATVNPLAIILKPGLVIGNYWPEGYAEAVASQRMAQRARSFARNGHREKLERNGVRVHEAGSSEETILPVLTPGRVSA